jgi:excisionase family DNA binding protein
MNDDEEVTAGEAAAILGVNRQRVNQLARSGRIGRQVAGRYWLFKRSELEAFKSLDRKGGRPKDEATGTVHPA